MRNLAVEEEAKKPTPQGKVFVHVETRKILRREGRKFKEQRNPLNLSDRNTQRGAKKEIRGKLPNKRKKKIREMLPRLLSRDILWDFALHLPKNFTLYIKQGWLAKS